MGNRLARRSARRARFLSGHGARDCVVVPSAAEQQHRRAESSAQSQAALSLLRIASSWCRFRKPAALSGTNGGTRTRRRVNGGCMFRHLALLCALCVSVAILAAQEREVARNYPAPVE